MMGDRKQAEMMLLQDRALPRAVVLVYRPARDVEVVSPAGQLEPVVPPSRSLLRKDLERQVRPLPREQRHRSSHRCSPQECIGIHFS